MLPASQAPFLCFLFGMLGLGAREASIPSAWFLVLPIFLLQVSLLFSSEQHLLASEIVPGIRAGRGFS